ncbi:MAG: hypothetical protein WDM92_12835 [Caulobacteraceae bacterium]
MTFVSPSPNRRTVLAAGLALAGAAAAPAALAKAAAAPLALYDPAEPAARAFAAKTASLGGRSLAIEGDRIRLARYVFGHQRPARVQAVARYADLLLLADAAREDGYRTTRLDRLARADGLFLWNAEPTSRA